MIKIEHVFTYLSIICLLYGVAYFYLLASFSWEFIFMLANNENPFYIKGLVPVAGISIENFPPVTTFLFIKYFFLLLLFDLHI